MICIGKKNPRTRSGPRALGHALLVGFALSAPGLGWPPVPAQAACLPDPAAAGDTVSCTGVNAAGYAVPTGVDEVAVIVEQGASVTAPGDGIVVESTSSVTNHGQIVVDGSGSSGILGGDGILGAPDAPIPYANGETGVITINAPAAYGIKVGGPTRTDNAGTIHVLGDGSVGISSQNSSGIFNTGTLNVSGANAIGVEGAPGVRFESTGHITVSGDQAIGAALGQGSQIAHGGSLTLSGAGTTGLVGAGNVAIDNEVGGVIVIEASAVDAVGLLSGDFGGQITNRGSITSTAPGSTAIQTGNHSDPSGNLGVISLNADNTVGVRGGDGSIVVNESGASLEMSGANAIGIQAGSGGQAINAGEMTITGDGARGLVGSDGTAQSPTLFSNESSANLSVIGDAALGADFGLFADGENSGTLSVQGAGALGVRAGTDSVFLNRGEISVGGADSIGIQIGAHSDPTKNSFVNAEGLSGAAGGILRSSDPAAGALVLMEEAAPGSENRIENQAGASILADTTDFAGAGRAIAIQGSAGADVVFNAGLIQGKILLGDGDDRFVAEPGSSLIDLGGPVLDGELGENTIELIGGLGDVGQFNPALTQNFASIRVASGQWQLTGQSAASSDVIVDRSGTLSIIDPITVNGNYSHAPPTTLIPQPGDPEPTLRALLNEATQLAPLLLTTGSATLDDGILEIVVGGGFRGSADFTLVHADGGIVNVFDRIALPDDPNFSVGTPIYSANELTLSLNVSGYSDNQWATSEALTALAGPGASSSAQDLLAQAETLDFYSYLSAMDQLAPSAYGAHTQATFELGNRFVQLMLERPSYCLGDQDQTGRGRLDQTICRERQLEPWITSYGQFSHRDGSAGHISAQDNAGGVVLGVDRRLNERFMVTATVGTAYDSLSVDGVGPGNFETLDLGLYAGYTRGSLRIQGVVSYGHSWQHRVREFSIGDFVGQARGNYGIDRLEVRAEAEYVYTIGALALAPMASLDYTALLQSEITETGGGAADLVLPSRTDTMRTLRVGINLTTALEKQDYWTELLENADGVWRPSLSVRWRQPLGNEDPTIHASFRESPGDRFSVVGENFDEGFEIGAGIDWTPLVADRLTFTLRYDGFLWQGVASHALTGRIRLAF